MKIKILIPLLLLFLSSCCENLPNNKPNYNVGDIVHLKLNPDPSYIIVDIEDKMCYIDRKDSFHRYDYTVKDNANKTHIIKEIEIK